MKQAYNYFVSIQDASTLNSLDVVKLKTLLGYLQSTKFELFLNNTFTGIYPDDDILTLLRLMASRQPGTNTVSGSIRGHI